MAETRQPTGILPYQSLRELVRQQEISAAEPIREDQVQPASLDLRLGPVAYRVRASFLPGPTARVEERIAAYGMHRFDLTAGAVLERGCVYVVPLLESLRLPSRVAGLANPKSSTGRLDIFTRLIADRSDEFDRVPAGYAGPLYAEIAPRTFSIVVRAGSRLNQLRLRRGGGPLGDAALKRLHQLSPLVTGPDGLSDIAGGIAVSLDLAGEAGDGPVGYKARKHTDLIDIDRAQHYEPLDFWEPIARRREARLILDPDDFYIVASREWVSVPPDHAAEMTPYNPVVGEFRAHYAGFFDPGFGWAEAGGRGSRAVLEIRSHEVPFAMEHGQVVARLAYEPLTDRPDRLYGAGIGSSYQRQGLALGKHFKQPERFA